MKNITITRTKNIANATYLPYAAYKRALELATAHKGEIGKTAEGNFQATFSSAKVAEKFVAEWTAEYEANRKVEPTVAPTPKSTPKAQKTPSSKPTATKGKTPSSTKKTTAPRKAKGEAFDFSTIKGETKKDKNKALHAMLVSMGHADSRTPEYQAVWNARPWAK
jgi:hypothetical protein